MRCLRLLLSPLPRFAWKVPLQILTRVPLLQQRNSSNFILSTIVSKTRQTNHSIQTVAGFCYVLKPNSRTRHNKIFRSFSSNTSGSDDKSNTKEGADKNLNQENSKNIEGEYVHEILETIRRPSQELEPVTISEKVVSAGKAAGTSMAAIIFWCIGGAVFLFLLYSNAIGYHHLYRKTSKKTQTNQRDTTVSWR